MLGIGHVVPERIGYVFGPVEIDHVEGARLREDVGKTAGRFVLDVVVLGVADKEVVVIDIQ